MNEQPNAADTREADHPEEELRQSRLAQVKAEGRVLDLESLVGTVEAQRDHAEELLKALVEAVHADHLTPERLHAYRAACKHLREVAGLDRYERRLAS